MSIGATLEKDFGILEADVESLAKRFASDPAARLAEAQKLLSLLKGAGPVVAALDPALATPLAAIITAVTEVIAVATAAVAAAHS